jgi:hypothetical protein
MSIHSKLSLMHRMAVTIMEEEAQGTNDVNLLEVMTGIAANLDMAVKATAGREPSREDQEQAWKAEGHTKSGRGHPDVSPAFWLRLAGGHVRKFRS